MVAVTFLDVLIFSLTGRSRLITAKVLCVLTFSRSGRSRIVFSPIGRCKTITAIPFCDLIFSLSGRNNYSIILGVLIFSLDWVYRLKVCYGQKVRFSSGLGGYMYIKKRQEICSREFKSSLMYWYMYKHRQSTVCYTESVIGI